MIVDLHSHSNVSDGELDLAELTAAARSSGVGVLAITDHDIAHSASELAGLGGTDLTLVSGIEFSASWRKLGVHIVGLNVDASSGVLSDAALSQKLLRQGRAGHIADILEKCGLKDPLEGASLFSGTDYIGRPHFARYMVKCGFVKDEKKAFQKYLSNEKITGIGYGWPAMETTIAWIIAAGGIAVLAHPLKYKLTRPKLKALCEDFKAAGGSAIEVVSGAQSESATALLSLVCREGGFLASCGSDFHKPGQNWAALGRFPALPSSCRPVWDAW